MLDYLYDLNREHRREMMRAADQWRLKQSALRHPRRIGVRRLFIGWTGRRLIAAGRALQQLSDTTVYDPVYPSIQSHTK